MKRLIVTSHGILFTSMSETAQQFKCALGKSGLLQAKNKREGDGATPVGTWPLRQVFYRDDRVSTPETGLPVTAIQKKYGWCDAPEDPNYNQLVHLPYAASHERLWRDDHVYDVIVELGHNDSPPVPGLGSAIFMHVAKPDYAPTEGCVALALEDLLAVLVMADQDTVMDIRA